MLPLWPTWCNPKLTSYLETSNFEQVYSNYDLAHARDPWLGKLMVTMLRRSDSTAMWNRLLSSSVHFNNLVNLNRGWRPVDEKITQHMTNGRIIVNMSADPFNGYEKRVSDILSQHTDQYLILSGDVKYWQHPESHICFMPFWYLHQRYTYNAVADITSDRKYALSSLNNQSRYHRIENFIKLRKKRYFDQLLFSMLYRYDAKLIRNQTPAEFYNRDIIVEFESIIPVEPLPFIGDGHAVNVPAYTDSYVNLVTETSIYDNTLFVSEKTWKPFMSGQFGIWLSNPGTVEFLRSIGLDVFDDILNGHTYDSELNLNQRIDNIHEIVDDLMTQDLGTVFRSTLARRQANIDRFYSAELEAVLTRQCQAYSAIINI